MTLTHRRGAWGEDLARLALEACGYECLDRRWRRPGGEIDLVMRRRGTVVFVEVKTRRAGALVAARDGVHPRQLARLRRLARWWLAEHPGAAPAGVRCDVVAVTCPGAGCGVELLHLVGVG